MSFSPLIERLVQALRCLPGVGPKSAQRMALDVLERRRTEGQRLAETLLEAIESVGHCRSCRTLSESLECALCAQVSRSDEVLCVVESVLDVQAIEETGQYRGRYFVLHGHLSPIMGIGPEELGIGLLEQRVLQLKPKEIIIATNPTAEGETTAYYLAKFLSDLSQGVGDWACQVSRIAHGVPLGGELGYLDGGTIGRAMLARTPLKA